MYGGCGEKGHELDSMAESRITITINKNSQLQVLEGGVGWGGGSQYSQTWALKGLRRGGEVSMSLGR